MNMIALAFVSFGIGLATPPLMCLLGEFVRQTRELYEHLDYYASPDSAYELTWFGRMSVSILLVIRRVVR